MANPPLRPHRAAKVSEETKIAPFGMTLEWLVFGNQQMPHVLNRYSCTLQGDLEENEGIWLLFWGELRGLRCLSNFGLPFGFR